jgi:curved DNA-binding protein CbpA
MLKSFVKTVKYNASTNLYKILGVKEDSNFEEIKRKYIEKIKTTHPDT